MARPRPQSTLRYPLSAILGTEGNLRVLRELARHGGELSAPSLVARTMLAPASVHQSLLALEALEIVARLGSGRVHLYRMRESHPIAPALKALFRDEEARFDAILAALRAAAAGSGEDIAAVWLYGSVARGDDKPTSDVDIVVIAKSSSA
jgi:DNA-binding transcriptional ArsR family regulator